VSSTAAYPILTLKVGFLLFYCLLMLVFSFFLFIRPLSPFYVLIFYCLFLFFYLVFYCPSFFPLLFSPLFLSLFFGFYGFHLYPTPTCLGLKDLVVVTFCFVS
jgi:hypothetical protein